MKKVLALLLGVGSWGALGCEPAEESAYEEVELNDENSNELWLTIEGNGTVHSEAGEIECANECRKRYWERARLRLVATPAAGETFLSWSGDCVDGTQALVPDVRESSWVEMGKDVRCVATFSGTNAPNPPLTVEIDPSQYGAVRPGTQLTLTALATGGAPAYLYTWFAVDHPEIQLPQDRTITVQIDTAIRYNVKVQDAVGATASDDHEILTVAPSDFEVMLPLPNFQVTTRSVFNLEVLLPNGMPAKEAFDDIAKCEWTIQIESDDPTTQVIEGQAGATLGMVRPRAGRHLIGVVMTRNTPQGPIRSNRAHVQFHVDP